ncbi:MAG TPA: trypsin-like peptidase domain-containing protein [Planctomycetota bacterium]|nr:trypsin-like peptidase domain-containing protein [Planctomycetota bacterium]
MNITRKLGLASVFAALAFTFAAPPAARAADDIKAAARSVAAKSAKAVVTVKLVVKMKMMGQEEEQKIEVTGTVIDPSGLTVVSASEIDPSSMLKAFFSGMGRRGGAGEMNFDSDVKETALIMDDGSEIDADVVMKDQDLDLAFIKPRDASQKFEAITLAKRKNPPMLLEDIFVLSRLGRLENRATALTQGTVKAIVKGPRTFYITDDETSQKGLGCVAFDASGAPLGVFVTKHNPEGAEGGQMGMLMGMMMGGKSKNSAAAAILRTCDDVLEIAEQAKTAKPMKKKAEETGTGEEKKDGGDAMGGGEKHDEKAPADGTKKPEEPKKEEGKKGGTDR